MQSAFLVYLALVTSSIAGVSSAVSPEAWSPMRVFVGAWAGSRSGSEGPHKVVRGYEPVEGNQQLQITERNGKQSGVWGVIRFDPERQAFVLGRSLPNGEESVLVLEPVSSETRLVFVSPEGSADRTRVSYERAGWNEFVERIEQATPGQDFVLVSEARFKRKQ
jgi:hypothetical protein